MHGGCLPPSSMHHHLLPSLNQWRIQKILMTNMSKKPLLHIVFAAILAAAVAPPMINGMNVKKLDYNTATDTTTVVAGGSSDDQIKCGGCPCNNPCYATSAPPPPPPPSPPPPKIPSPTPGQQNCPPPPTTGGGYGQMAPPSYIYITGPPGNLYPVNPYFSAAVAHRNLWVAPSLLVVVFGLVGVLIFY